MSDDVLVKVEGVSKKFCRSLKRSLWYGVQDVASETARRLLKSNISLQNQQTLLSCFCSFSPTAFTSWIWIFSQSIKALAVVIISLLSKAPFFLIRNARFSYSLALKWRNAID